MEWEVRWPDGQTEQVQGDAASSWDWKPVGDGVFDVRMGHRNVRVELVNGPDKAGHVLVRVSGVERQLQVLDRQMLLLCIGPRQWCGTPIAGVGSSDASLRIHGHEQC